MRRRQPSEHVHPMMTSFQNNILSGVAQHYTRVMSRPRYPGLGSSSSGVLRAAMRAAGRPESCPHCAGRCDRRQWSAPHPAARGEHRQRPVLVARRTNCTAEWVTAFDVVKTEFIQPCSNHQFILQREIHPFSLRTITQSRVVQLYSCHDCRLPEPVRETDSTKKPSG